MSLTPPAAIHRTSVPGPRRFGLAGLPDVGIQRSGPWPYQDHPTVPDDFILIIKWIVHDCSTISNSGILWMIFYYLLCQSRPPQLSFRTMHQTRLVVVQPHQGGKAAYLGSGKGMESPWWNHDRPYKLSSVYMLITSIQEFHRIIMLSIYQ